MKKNLVLTPATHSLKQHKQLSTQCLKTYAAIGKPWGVFYVQKKS